MTRHQLSVCCSRTLRPRRRDVFHGLDGTPHTRRQRNGDLRASFQTSLRDDGGVDLVTRQISRQMFDRVRLRDGGGV